VAGPRHDLLQFGIGKVERHIGRVLRYEPTLSNVRKAILGGPSVAVAESCPSCNGVYEPPKTRPREFRVPSSVDLPNLRADEGLVDSDQASFDEGWPRDSPPSVSRWSL
jgi:hypothetical protein